MERLMHKRFFAANQELRGFLRRAEGLAIWSDTVSEEELKTIWHRMLELAPEVKDASACDTLDAELQEEIAAYVKNLKALQQAVETIRCVMLARRAVLDSTRRHLDGLQGWVHAYQQTM
jgi:hypothetical protein